MIMAMIPINISACSHFTGVIMITIVIKMSTETQLTSSTGPPLRYKHVSTRNSRNCERLFSHGQSPARNTVLAMLLQIYYTFSNIQNFSKNILKYKHKHITESTAQCILYVIVFIIVLCQRWCGVDDCVVLDVEGAGL